MLRRLALFLSAGFMMTAPGASEEAPDGATMNSVRPLITQDSMNVYRRFEPEQTAAMVEFYDEVLGLTPLQPIDLGGGQTMILFEIGGGQIKLAAGLKEGREYHIGGVKGVTGIRFFTLFFPDEAALVEQFEAHGLMAPAFVDTDAGRRVALVRDPGEFPLKLVILPEAAPGSLEKLEVDINVSSLDESRAFYRDFVGLDELPPTEDHLIGITKHPYRHGATTINLWSAGRDLPADTGSAGIQYVVSDVEAVDASAKARRIAVEEPLGGLPGFNLRFVWLNDPDGVTNYFAQIGGAEETED